MLQRYKVISLTVAAVFICYIDRVVISLAIIPMSEGMGWSETQRGFILSSFYIGYILTQIIGGLLSDRMGHYQDILFMIFIPQKMKENSLLG